MHSSLSSTSAASTIGIWRASFAGFAACLVGIGLARFAYSPLIPALIEAQWFTPQQAVYLGAANLLGYFIGVWSSGGVMRRWRAAPVLRAMMLLTAASLFACAFRGPGFAWFFVWRIISGGTGGVIIVLAAPTVLAQAPAERRGLVGGVIFTGVGLGVAASGTLMPFILGLGGVRAAWLGLAGLALLLTGAAWTSWPAEASVRPASAAAEGAARPYTFAAKALVAVYALNVVGLVPHMIFFVDYVARGLGLGLQVGAAYWTLYGIGAALGPLLAGQLADRVGFAAALRLALVAQAAAVVLPVISAAPASLVVSSSVVGALTIGIVPLVLGRVHELVRGAEAQRRVWRGATLAFALFQAASAYGFSYLFGATGSYILLFGLGAVAFVGALALDLATAFTRAAPGKP